MINKVGKKDVEELWRTEKYKVMYYNQNQYNLIRQYMKENLDDLNTLQKLLNETYRMKPTQGSKLNSYQHMWGYFKKIATPEERALYIKYSNDFNQYETHLHLLIQQLTEQYNVTYLKNSSILND